MRFAELGTVYRYERSGVLHGLPRVRGFTQDDAHIFCQPEQIDGRDQPHRLSSPCSCCGRSASSEFQVYLATRPEKAHRHR